MRVVFFSYDAPNHISGVDSWLKRLLPELVLLGIEPWIVFITRGERAELKKVKFFVENNINTRCIKAELFPYSQDRTKEVLRTIREINPDIVLPGYIVSAFYAIKWIKQSGIRTVGILHSDDLFYNAIAEEYTKNSDWKLDACVSVSNYLHKKLVQIASKEIPLYQIGYGVPLAKGLIQRTGRELKLIYIGRLENEQKRIVDVAHALCNVVKMYPFVTAAIYGNGSSKKEVLDILDSQEEKKVVYKGVIESEVMYQTLMEYHSIVLLSDYEGLPVSLLEAMACGLVPICLNMESGVNDLISHKQNGLIVNDRENNFYSAVAKLLDLEFWRFLSLNARKTIENGTGYSIKGTAETWKSLFSSLAENQPNKNKKVNIPIFIKLPKQNQALWWENEHRPEISKRIINKIRRIIESF